MRSQSYEFVTVESCESTQELARKKLNATGKTHWVFTENMLNGRGRAGKKWECLKGNFFLSSARTVSVSDNDRHWPFVSLLGALALVEGLKHEQLWTNDLFIKWPNDLWTLRQGAGAKLGGMLAERKGKDLVFGLGLNTHKAPSLVGSEYSAASLHASECNLSLAQQFSKDFEKHFEQWLQSPATSQKAIAERLWHSYMKPMKYASIYREGNKTPFVATGLSPEGAILLQDPSNGSVESCHSGEVQVRF